MAQGAWVLLLQIVYFRHTFRVFFMKEMEGKMAKTRFSEELIAFALRQAELGASVCKIFTKTLDRFLICIELPLKVLYQSV